MSSTFGQPVNNFQTSLASAHVVSDGQLVLATGSGAGLGSLPSGRIFRVTALLNPETTSEIVLAIFEASGLSTDTLTGITAVEGFADVALSAGTTIEVRITAKTVGELQTAINTIENNYVSTATLTSTLAAYAPLASPALTGTPTAPTAAGGTNNTQLATTAFVTAAVAAGVAIGVTVGGSPTDGELLYVTASGTLGQVPWTYNATTNRTGVNVPSAQGAVIDISHNSTQTTKAIQVSNTSTSASDLYVNSGTTTFQCGALQGQAYYKVNSADPLFFATNGSEHIYITSGGLVWIGSATTGVGQSPNGQLEVDPLSTTTVGIVVQAQASQTAPLVQLWLVSSTSTKRAAATIDSAWVTSTDASRTGRLLLKAEDFTGTSREGIRIESTGSAAAIGVFGTTAAVQQTGGAKTAGSSYTSTEQTMLQTVYNALRTFGWLS